MAGLFQLAARMGQSPDEGRRDIGNRLTDFAADLQMPEPARPPRGRFGALTTFLANFSGPARVGRHSIGRGVLTGLPDPQREQGPVDPGFPGFSRTSRIR